MSYHVQVVLDDDDLARLRRDEELEVMAVDEKGVEHVVYIERA